MASTKSKGNERENLVANHLRDRGYLVMVSPRTMRKVGLKYYSMSNDYFNLFDLCAKYWGGYTRWIQIKSGMSDYYKCRKKLTEMENYFCGNNEFIEVWVRTKKDSRIVWRIFILTNGVWEEHPKLSNKFEKI